MPIFKSSEEWLQQSALLIQARPTTTRVTTKYTTTSPTAASEKSKKRKRKDPKDSSVKSPESTNTPSEPVPTGSLTLKAFDPVSGACLKYSTDKAAEVGRLIAALGRLSKTMAALPDQGLEETAKTAQDTPQTLQGKEVADADTSGPASNTGASAGPDAAGGAKKKKKKAKK